MRILLLAAAGLLLVPAPGVWGEGVLRRVELSGASAYDEARVLKILRLRPGQTVRASPERLAEVLTRRYHDDGYLGASVRAQFAPDEGLLTLQVDEGRLASVTLPALDAPAQARAVQALALAPGRALRATDVDRAWWRLEEASEGALRPGDYEVRQSGGDVVLELRPEIQRFEATAGIRGPHTAGFYNRVDGFNLGASLGLRLGDLRRYEHTRFVVAAAYGFGSDALRYTAGISRPVARGRATLGYEWHDLTDRDDAYRLTGLDEGPGTSLLEGSLSDFYARRGHELYAFAKLAPSAQVGVSFRADRYASLAVTTDGDPFGSGTPRDNPEVDPGDMRSVLVTLRLTTAPELFGERGIERRSFLLRSLWGTLEETPDELRLEATLERSVGGDFDFTRLTSALRDRRALGSVLRLDSRVLLGLASDAAPRQRRLVLGGAGTLRGYELGAFAGDTLAAATAELSARAPGPLPRLIGFYDGGATWSASAGDSGWKSSLGAGLRWPADGATFVRVDAAWAVGDAAAHGTRWLWRLQLPL